MNLSHPEISELDLSSTILMGTLLTSATRHEHLESDEGNSYMSRVCISILLGLIAITGIIGNSLVIVAVWRYPHLRTISNYFILSLTFADFLISTLVMPLAIYNFLHHGKWYTGTVFCATWTFLAVMFSTASILSLCAVSIHRYFAVTKPVRHASRVRNRSFAYKYIGIVWTTSVVVSVPSVVALSTVEDHCRLGGSTVYAVLPATVSFFIPSLIIVILYVKIYNVAKYTARTSIAPTVTSVMLSMCDVKSGVRVSTLCTVPQQNMSTACRRHEREISVHCRAASFIFTDNDVNHRAESQGDPPIRRKYTIGPRSRISLRRERKAARTVTILIGVFLFCWAPFFTINVLSNLVSSLKIPWEVYTLLEWFGWANSAINPTIYTIFKKDFLLAFKKMLRLRGPGFFRSFQQENKL